MTYGTELKYLALLTSLLSLFSFIQQGNAASLISLIEQLGWVGIFMAAFLGNLAMFVQVPYPVLLLSQAIGGASLPTMLFLGIVSGVGAGIGKNITYQVVYNLVPNHNKRQAQPLYQRVNKIIEQYPRYVSLVIFLVIALPVPDEAVIIPLTLMRCQLRKVWLVLFLGKFSHNVMLAIMMHFGAALFSHQVVVPSDLVMYSLLCVGFLAAYRSEKSQRFAQTVS